MAMVPHPTALDLPLALSLVLPPTEMETLAMETPTVHKLA
jgi:hypothetical protein